MRSASVNRVESNRVLSVFKGLRGCFGKKNFSDDGRRIRIVQRGASGGRPGRRAAERIEAG